jgi:dTDP-4-dehydrorhamnose 3,5-epimerase
MTVMIPAELVAIPQIEGVYARPLKRFADERGAFTETFRAEWFPMVNWSRLQMNRSISKEGVLRGLHYHFHQVDVWLLQSGQIRVGLADLRPTSSTYLRAHAFDLHADDLSCLYIPIGVAHGFYSASAVELLYVVSNYYHGADERGVAWNDPTLKVPWGINAPVLSNRDLLNRPLADIPIDERPR